jgi:hypothetical protein
MVGSVCSEVVAEAQHRVDFFAACREHWLGTESGHGRRPGMLDSYHPLTEDRADLRLLLLVHGWPLGVVIAPGMGDCVECRAAEDAWRDLPERERSVFPLEPGQGQPYSEWCRADQALSDREWALDAVRYGPEICRTCKCLVDAEGWIERRTQLREDPQAAAALETMAQLKAAHPWLARAEAPTVPVRTQGR